MKRKILGISISVAMLVGSLGLQGCGKSDLSKLHDTLNSAAVSLNAAAKTNRNFYEGGIYGAVGSPDAIAMRQKGAKAVHDANEKLIVALNLAKGLTAATFEQGKLAVLQALGEMAKTLNTGNSSFDLVLSTVVTLVNRAVTLIQGFQANHLRFVLPEIQTWEIPKLTEVNV